MNGAAVHHRHMTDQHVVADDQRRALLIARARWVAMQYAAILHIGALADANAEHIGPDHAIVPDRAARTDFYIADYRAAGRDKGGVVDLGRFPVDRNDVDARAYCHCAAFHCSRVSLYWIVGLSCGA